MKLTEILLLFVYSNLEVEKEHNWQFRWQKKIVNSKIIHSKDMSSITKEIINSQKPVVIVAHRYAVETTIMAIEQLETKYLSKIKGCFFVAPAFQKQDNMLSKLPCPSFLISSNNDTLLKQDEAKKIAEQLGSFFLDAGENGNIDEKTGHGPWPEGLLVLSKFLSKIN